MQIIINYHDNLQRDEFVKFFLISLQTIANKNSNYQPGRNCQCDSCVFKCERRKKRDIKFKKKCKMLANESHNGFSNTVPANSW